jgi:hypothetical protein
MDGVKEALRSAIKQSGLSREVVAEEVSRLTGEKIGTNQIDNWTAPEKKDRRIPLDYVAALSVVLNDDSITQAAFELAEMFVLSKEKIPFYELGKMTAEDIERRKQKKQLMETIRK